ncbi:MAG: hypothetical protein WD851_14620 [Pirellulales bacterium]
MPTSIVLLLAATFGLLFSASKVRAVESLAYSFESGTDENPDQFGPNGGGITVAADTTTGVTLGTYSMKTSLVAGATFAGTLSTDVNPTPTGEIIGDPPGIDYVLLDLTVAPGDEFPGGEGSFAVVGVTIFGASQPDRPGGQQFGLQAQFKHEVHIDGLAAGTYHDIRINLADAHTHPLTFVANQSFNEIFGEAGSGANDVIPSGFQLFLNKTNNLPLTVYFDNVRVGTNPPGVPGDYNGDGAVNAADYTLWRDGGALLNEVADPGTVSPADYTEWRARFGNTSGSGGGVSAVPEPSGVLLALAAACGLGAARLRWRSFAR